MVLHHLPQSIPSASPSPASPSPISRRLVHSPRPLIATAQPTDPSRHLVISAHGASTSVHHPSSDPDLSQIQPAAATSRTHRQHHPTLSSINGPSIQPRSSRSIQHLAPAEPISRRLDAPALRSTPPDPTASGQRFQSSSASHPASLPACPQAPLSHAPADSHPSIKLHPPQLQRTTATSRRDFDRRQLTEHRSPNKTRTSQQLQTDHAHQVG
ncbi:hypothetical protein ACLOJK_028786 [Asimina triloba]